MKIRIRRAYVGNKLLELRVYEALKQSRFCNPKEKWNRHGRKYDIRGLYNLTRTPGVCCEFENHIEEDINRYIGLLSSRKIEFKKADKTTKFLNRLGY